MNPRADRGLTAATISDVAGKGVKTSSRRGVSAPSASTQRHRHQFFDMREELESPRPYLFGRRPEKRRRVLDRLAFAGGLLLAGSLVILRASGSNPIAWVIAAASTLVLLSRPKLSPLWVLAVGGIVGAAIG